MKRLFSLLSVLLMVTLAMAQERGFIHPGLLHTEADFVRVRKQLADGDSVVTAGFNNLKANQYSSSTAATYPVETIIRGGSGENYMNAARGAHIAYMNALMWHLTGNEANARHAVDVLNSWASTTTYVDGNSNYALASGIYGYEFANAAELMRTYNGWRAADFKAFQDWMLTVWYPRAIEFLRERNDTWLNSAHWWQAPGHYWSNWGLCNALCVMSIGILCDDPYVYNQGVSFYKYDQVGSFVNKTPDEVADGYIWNWGLTEYLGNLVPIEHAVPDSLLQNTFGKISQMQESGRDQGHSNMALGLAIDICQTAFNQGDDLFAYMNNRLAGGIEHVAAYNVAMMDNLPFTTYKIQTNGFTVADGRGGTHTVDASGSRSTVRNFWERVMGYYEGIQGAYMPYARMACEAMGIDGGASGGTSGSYDHLGYTSLMCHKPKVDRSLAPVKLSPKITLKDGTTYEQSELGGLQNTPTTMSTGIAPGTELTLSVSLEDGTVVARMNITADSSKVYRLSYKAPNGTISTQAFSIAVKGDSRIDTTATADIKTPIAISYENKQSIYDLSGRKAQRTSGSSLPGVYIVNGRKVLVRN